MCGREVDKETGTGTHDEADILPVQAGEWFSFVDDVRRIKRITDLEWGMKQYFSVIWYGA
jgi:hypothetical protein